VGKVGGSAETSSDLLYEYKWKFQPRPNAPENRYAIPALDGVIASAKAEVAKLLADMPQRERNEGLRVQLESACAGLVWDTVKRLGAELKAGDAFTAAELADKLGVSEGNRRLFARCLDILAEDRVLSRTAGGFKVPRVPEVADPFEALRKTVAAHPTASAEV